MSHPFRKNHFFDLSVYMDSPDLYIKTHAMKKLGESLLESSLKKWFLSQRHIDH